MEKYQHLGRGLTYFELKNIKGGNEPDPGEGGNWCEIQYNGQFTVIQTSGTCPQQSSQANAYCVHLIDIGATSQCGYDCACDGMGV